MKKILIFTLSAMMLFSLSACGSNQPNQSTPTPSSTAPSETPSSTTAPSEATPPTTEPSSSETQEPGSEPSSTDEPQIDDSSKILVAYFSMPETADASNMTQDEDNSVVVIDGEVLGNTQYVAMLIQENTGGDIFRIEPQTPYPTNHATLVDLADKEQEENARPALLANVENPEQYDVVFLGYPNWWADMPMVLYTFLESHDLSGKTIIPFNTHGGSGFSNSIQTIAELQPNATVITNGFTVSRNSVADCAGDVAAWLEQHGYAK